MWDQGANLFLVSRNRPVVDLPECPGQTVDYMQVDLSYSWFTDFVMGEIQEVWSHVDGLINNAAVQGPVGATWETNWSEWIECLCLNLETPIQLCRMFVPWMLKQGHGKIVNLSGGGAAYGRPNYSAYAVAKTGLVRFSECLAMELEGEGIDVNCVAPGPMPTDMLPPNVDANPNSMSEAAALIVFLLSDESNGISGRLISALHDDWRALAKRHTPLPKEVYTLRRMI